MEDNSILIPTCPTVTQDIEDTNILYLLKDNYLSEYNTENDKEIVRKNLDVPSSNLVYTKDETNTLLQKETAVSITEHLNLKDPHGIISEVEKLIVAMVKTDGSTPFTEPQIGVDPIKDYHLATKRFVNYLLNEHISLDDPHNLVPKVRLLLEQYVQISDVYNKDSVYNKEELDKILETCVKKDGSVSFENAQVGKTPTKPQHLATKKYIDDIFYAHTTEKDPHGLLSTFKATLNEYAKAVDVYTKSQTYSKSELDYIILNCVDRAIKATLSNYTLFVQKSIKQVTDLNYIKSDGSVRFEKPQEGVDAITENHLTTLKQVDSKINVLKEDLESKISNKEDFWKTSGSVETTVGYFDSTIKLNDSMSLQLICDIMFYGKYVDILADTIVNIGSTGKITICTYGPLDIINSAELYKNGEIFRLFTGEDFANTCITIDSDYISEDTVFKIKVLYNNGTYLEKSTNIKCNIPAFVGLLPKFKFGYTLNYQYLKELTRADDTGTLNLFVNILGNEFTFKYKFEDSNLRHPMILIPNNYPLLVSMYTRSQDFSLEAFDQVTGLVIKFPEISKDIYYNAYIYKLALALLDQNVTFIFK